jgi:hypothetical protein
MNFDMVRAIPTQYMLLGVAALVAASMGFGWLQGAHGEQIKAAKFEAATEAFSVAAKQHAEQVAKADKLRKEKADAENKRTINNLRADVKRLRDERTRGGGLSAPAPSAESPDRICFDPAKLSGALRKFDEGVLGLVEGCSESVINLDTAKKWAQENE